MLKYDTAAGYEKIEEGKSISHKTLSAPVVLVLIFIYILLLELPSLLVRPLVRNV